MSRPTDHEKRAALAREAVEVLRREGVDLPMSTLAARLGINRTTLLYYFPTKAAILERELEDLLTAQAAFVVPRMLAHDHPLDQLEAQMRAVHAFHEGREDRIVFLSQAIAAAGITGDNRFIEIGNQVFHAQRVAMRERVGRAIQAGAMQPCDADALMSVVRSLIDGLLVLRVMTGCDLAPVHAFIRQHIFAPLRRDGRAPSSQSSTDPSAHRAAMSDAPDPEETP